MRYLRVWNFAGFVSAFALLVLPTLCEIDGQVLAADEEKATSTLRQAARFLEGQKQFQVTIDLEQLLESVANRKMVPPKSEFLMSLSRPNQIAIRSRTGRSMSLVANDGKVLQAAFEKCELTDGLTSLDEVLYEPLLGVMFLGDGAAFLRAFLSAQAADELLYDAESIEHVASEDIQGHTCRHWRLVQGQALWNVWVDAGDVPLVRRASIEPREPFEEGSKKNAQHLRMTVTFHFRDWEFSPKFSDDEFALTPPTGASKVDSLFPRGPRHDFAKDKASLTDVGEPAPDVPITPLGGEPIRLADLRGRVVLLNFFATWCGPCQMEMPDLERIWHEFREEADFRMFVIDREESAETVEAYKAEHDYTFPLAIDVERATFNGFAGSGIPRTYVIDRDGKIVYQCVGYDFRKRERKKLRAILKQELNVTSGETSSETK